jgi:phosphoserine phosphatase
MPEHKKYQLICFDVDGTLIADNEGHGYWNTLHHVIEGEEGIRKNNERLKLFLEKKITYKEWVELDFLGFKEHGLTKDDFIRAANIHKLSLHAREVILELKRKGYKLAIISGGIDILVDTLFPDHPFDDMFINKIFFSKDGTVSGWENTAYDGGSKHQALISICHRENIDLAHTVFIGDGENDIDILEEAGLGIAFCPKSDKVRQAADVIVEVPDMREILKHL